MKKKLIEFKLNKDEYIKFELPVCLSEIYPLCDEIDIKFSIKKIYNFNIGKDFIKYQTEMFYCSLCSVLENKIDLHKSIDNDIGLKNLVWQTPGNFRPSLSTWLYNNLQGSIILEVTPDYPWHFMENAEEDKEFLPYDEWIKSYEPLFIRTIPREIAIKWRDQAKEILEKLKKNEHKLCS